jgi:hypothetical protein
VSIASAPLQALDTALSGALGELLAGGDFEGKQGQASKALRLMGAGGGPGPKYVALLGLGKAQELGQQQWGASAYQVGVSGGRGG